MPPLLDAQLVLIAHRHQDGLIRVSNSVAAQIGVLWDNLGGLSDDALARFSTTASDLIVRTQRWAIADAQAYIRTYVGQALGSPSLAARAAIDQAQVLAGLRGGVPSVDVYRRPIITARGAIANGKTFEQAMAYARDRAMSAARTDLALARRAGAHAAMQVQPSVVGQRRVPDANACEYCLIASTQRYHRADLQPLHTNCNCDVVPIVGTADPGRIINRETYKRLKAGGAMDRQTESAAGLKLRKQARESRERATTARGELEGETDPARRRRIEARATEWDTKATSYDKRAAEHSSRRRTEIAVHEHGELGPVLARKGDRFTGPSDI